MVPVLMGISNLSPIPLPMPTSPPATAHPTEDETEYLRWGAESEFFRPDYSRSLTAIAPALLSLLGRPVEGAADLSAFLPGGSPRRASRVLLLCIDGLGFKELALAARLPALHREWGTWVTSVFPSITSTAITSMYLGLPPSRHGILGHRVWKDLPGGIVDMLRMQVVGAKLPLAAAGFEVNGWKREPGVMDGPHADGLTGIQLMPAAIVGSGLSAYCYGNTQLLGFLEPMEGFAKAAHLLSDMRNGWVGMYLSTVDSLTHALGSDIEPVQLALRHIEDGLTWMASRLPTHVLEDTALMVVADHGQSPVRRTVPLEGAAWEWLEAHTRAIGFSGRVMHVYLGPQGQGQEAEAAARLKALMGDLGEVLTYEQARGLVGPEPDGSPGDAEWVRQTLGDLVAVLRGEVNWDKRRPGDLPFPYGNPLQSHHGAMSSDEMFVPLILAPLSALRGA